MAEPHFGISGPFLTGYTLEWVDFFYFFYILNKRHSGVRSVVPLVKTWTIAKKVFFRSIDLYHRGHNYLGHSLYRGKQIFPQCGLNKYQKTQNFT
jgi:hypothetical protein